MEIGKRVLFAGVVIAIACGPHEDYTPLIHVDPNAAKRIDLVHRPDKPPATTARVHPMRAGEELGGPNATGKSGDLILENDEVAFVIEQLGHQAGFGVTGGNIIDAADAKVRKDELGQMLTYFGAFPRQGAYESIDSGIAKDGAAFVESRGHELNEAKLAVKTRYTLHPNDRALLLETTLENQSDQPIVLLGLGDALQWGGAEKFAPDRGRGFKGASSGSFLAGVGRFASYAITSTDGMIDADSGPGWSDTLQARRTEIPAGKSLQYTRVFLVGPRADVSGLVAELTKTSGGGVGTLQIDLMGDAGKVTPSPDATIEISVGGKPIMDLRPDATGALSGELPPGKYELKYAGGGGRGARGSAQAVEIAANQSASAKLDVTAPAKLHARCMERPDPKTNASPVPCKATFEGLGVTNPEFGPGHNAGPARNQVTTKDGNVDVPLAPGKYRVTLSRGPEYALSQFEVDVQPGAVDGSAAGGTSQAATVEACNVGERCLLRRVVDTKGWLACDFHQHTMLGVDAPTNTRDRVIGNVAEGVELAVASEHNIVADLEPLVREMGLADRLVEIAGDELTTDTSHRPWGHANVFPLVPQADHPNGGAIVVRDRDVKDLFTELRAQNPNAVFMINHPRSGGNGYFDLLDFDRAKGVGTDPRYDGRFDALEVWNGRNVAQRGAVLEDALAMLRTSHPVTLIGTTDTHGMVTQEAGYPRTYVRAKDDALDAWDASRTAEMVRTIRETREVVVTNGPFIRVKRMPIGGVTFAKGATNVEVVVTAAPWVDVTKVKLVRAAKNETLEKPVTMHATPSGAREATVTFTLDVTTDDAFVVIASGEKPLSPVLPGDAAEIRPYALTGAIWLDADGDKHALGR